MNSVVDQRKDKFNRYKDLRQNPAELLEPAIKPVAEYGVWDRINDVTDKDSFKEFGFDFEETNPLEFEGYVQKKEELRKETDCHDAIVAGTCKIGGYEVALAVMN